ncbi:hypothetical protein [Kibdelosporangium phytohabitans]|uniref:Uncharacterized protein n=1 Tax=Kibdelosporangium phytohabitans TaxID=860235 RepID=A0A0N9I2F7_9PSEU|nr:hypothetical protein [Kibdelosporangium phytohabitans]ALG08899.1 hypothetical protein AOZ06_20040 [Kibdelosporangium phytohabitans]MBE1469946.1 hypothetical protein [Kibdelosporangium phytohabitans]
MEVLLLKVTLTPSLILIASLTAKRIGPRFSGRLLGLPLTTGPFLTLIWLEAGPGTAASAAHGAALGQLTVVVFCLAYATAAVHIGPAAALSLSVLCGLMVAAAAILANSLWLCVAAPIAAILYRPALAAAEPGRPSRWDLPVRVVAAGGLVVLLTATTPLLGPVLAGALAALPMVSLVLAPSMHRSSGGAAAVGLLTGVLISAASTMAFLVVVAVAMVPLGPLTAFGLGVAALVITDLTTRGLRSRRTTTV